MRSPPSLFVPLPLAVLAFGCTNQRIVGGTTDGGMDATLDVSWTSPPVACGGRCVDPSSGPVNCGACGTACGRTQVCATGRCQDSCPTGQVLCGGRCVTTDTDRAHCGACGNACGAGLSETRVGYDETTHSLYFVGFAEANLYRWDIATSTLTAMTPHPEGALNDAFCADRSGHQYAAGGFSGNTIWQFDIATNAWRRIVDFPVDQGNNGSCSAHEDGWIYLETGSLTDLYRIQLF